jgi:hypothetical protein
VSGTGKVPADLVVLNRFRSLAAEYVRLVEGETDADAVLVGSQTLLPSLYLAALALPEAAGTDGCNDRLGPSDEEWKAQYARLSEVLGAKGLYWEVYDPRGFEPGEVVAGSLADDLSDVWRDLKRGSAFWELGRSDDAVWSWRFHFEIHWGDHVANALRAIHWNLNGGAPETPSSKGS